MLVRASVAYVPARSMALPDRPASADPRRRRTAAHVQRNHASPKTRRSARNRAPEARDCRVQASGADHHLCLWLARPQLVARRAHLGMDGPSRRQPDEAALTFSKSAPRPSRRPDRRESRAGRSLVAGELAPAGRSWACTESARRSNGRDPAPPLCPLPRMADRGAARVRSMSPGRRTDLTDPTTLSRLPSGSEASPQPRRRHPRQSSSVTDPTPTLTRGRP